MSENNKSSELLDQLFYDLAPAQVSDKPGLRWALDLETGKWKHIEEAMENLDVECAEAIARDDQRDARKSRRRADVRVDRFEANGEVTWFVHIADSGLIGFHSERLARLAKVEIEKGLADLVASTVEDKLERFRNMLEVFHDKALGAISHVA